MDAKKVVWAQKDSTRKGKHYLEITIGKEHLVHFWATTAQLQAIVLELKEYLLKAEVPHE